MFSYGCELERIMNLKMQNPIKSIRWIQITYIKLANQNDTYLSFEQEKLQFNWELEVD